jgi:hypothetical protein
MEEKLSDKIQEEKLVCERCKLVIPYVFKKGPRYTCPSFTMVDEKAVCYHCYHPSDY